MKTDVNTVLGLSYELNSNKVIIMLWVCDFTNGQCWDRTQVISHTVRNEYITHSEGRVVWYTCEDGSQVTGHTDGLVQDCSISITNTLEILQYCTKPSIQLSPIITW